MGYDPSKKIQTSDSPCIRNCCLDENDICLGCFRHIDEIVSWRSYSSEDKQKVAKRCQQRRDNH